ncbi:MAG TPA: hypothetical protein VEL11_00505 [Candidatus Bathyarchaeia archaeon]|nr:hypothetical protein [Candidatus Bathyarchaeia archaeon]
MYITNDRKCHKLLSNDGITSPVLIIDKVEGLFEGITVNVKFQKTRFASIGSTSSFAKNLDEYQYIVCHEIRSIPDINPYKKELQKYRVLIISAFAKLIPMLASLSSDKNLQEWNRFAQILLTQVSETLVKARDSHERYDGTNSKLRNSTALSKQNQIKDVCKFLDISEQEMDKLLEDLYL